MSGKRVRAKRILKENLIVFVENMRKAIDYDKESAKRLFSALVDGRQLDADEELEDSDDDNNADANVRSMLYQLTALSLFLSFSLSPCRKRKLFDVFVSLRKSLIASGTLPSRYLANTRLV